MAIRAQPVKSVFARMPRIVRDLAATLGKEVRIVTAGKMTEIDKTVIRSERPSHPHDPKRARSRNRRPGSARRCGKPARVP